MTITATVPGLAAPKNHNKYLTYPDLMPSHFCHIHVNTKTENVWRDTRG